jgi:hypothetical protein
VRPPAESASEEDCPECRFEQCVIDTARKLKNSNYRMSNYSIWGPNSNSFARRLVEVCGGSVSGNGPPTGWSDISEVGF